MAYKKILIINIFGIGDVLFTTPLLRNIKENFPDIFIGYLANRRTAPIVEENPLVDKVYIYERDEYYSVYKKSKFEFLQKMQQGLRELKDEKFDCVIDLSLNGSVSFFMWFIGIKERIGFNFRNRSFFLSKKVPLKGYEGRHVVEYYADLLGQMGIQSKVRDLELYISGQNQQWADQFFKDHDLVPGSTIAIFPGGGASWGKDAEYKRWSAQQFAQLADKVIETFSAKVILLGSQAEAGLCRQVKQAMHNKVVPAYGTTSIAQSAALLQKSSLAIVNDGGPLHMAVAVGTKTVSIFGPVDERVYGPYPKGDHEVVTAKIACRPCYRQFRRADCVHISCLKNIEVEDVFAKVTLVLKGKTQNRISSS